MKKKLISLVFPGVILAFASDFLCASVLMSEDFPTFDLPKNATSGSEGGGHCWIFAAEVINEEVMLII